MRRCLYEHRHWYFFVSVLPRSYPVRFLNNVLQFILQNWNRNENHKGIFFSVLRKIFPWDYFLYLTEKKNTNQFQISRGDDNCTWILTGTWLQLGWLKPTCLHAFALWSHCNQILPSLLEKVSWIFVHIPKLGMKENKLKQIKKRRKWKKVDLNNFSPSNSKDMSQGNKTQKKLWIVLLTKLQ